MRDFLQKYIGPKNAHYPYPECVLDCIQYLAPRDIVGKIRENAYPRMLEMFCDVLKIPEITKTRNLSHHEMILEMRVNVIRD